MAALVLILTACSTLTANDAQRSLDITLLPDGSKQFVYRIAFRRDTRGDPRIAGSMQSDAMRRSSRRTPGERDYKALQRNTGETVAAAGYCHNGYLELDYRLSVNVFWLRGECREAATVADIERFEGVSQIPLAP